MEIKKKEIGENLIVNFDSKQYKIFMDGIKKIAQLGEGNSNINKLVYSVVISGRKKPYMNVKGWCSRVIDKNGKVSEVVFIDYDCILFDLMKSELEYIQNRYNLAPHYIFKTFESIDDDGRVYGNYLIINPTKKTMKEVIEIQSLLHCDVSYKFVPTTYKYKTWVLRLSGKGKKDSPKFECIIGDQKKEYNMEVSQAHLEVMKKAYPEIPEIKYSNLDGNHNLFMSEYKTASK